MPRMNIDNWGRAISNLVKPNTKRQTIHHNIEIMSEKQPSVQ